MNWGPPYKMPEPEPNDGTVAAYRVGRRLALEHKRQDGVVERIEFSEHTWWQMFGLLALMLGFKLSPALGKAILLRTEAYYAEREKRATKTAKPRRKKR